MVSTRSIDIEIILKRDIQIQLYGQQCLSCVSFVVKIVQARTNLLALVSLEELLCVVDEL